LYIDYYFIFNVTILLGNTMKILIAIGGREYSKPTLDLGMKIANSFKSSTTIAYVGKKISQFSEKDVSVVHQNLDERELYRPGIRTLEWAYDFLISKEYIQEKVANKFDDYLLVDEENSRMKVLLKGQQSDKIDLYGSIYIYALIIPVVSVLGVFLAAYLRNQKIKKLQSQGLELKEEREGEKTNVNWWILGGSLIFVIFTLSIGSFKVPFAQEIVFIGSVIIILFLMFKLIKELPEHLRLTIVGTAVIIFIFRAMPGPGPGLTWFEIDVLEFNEQFFSVLSLLASILTLAGIVLLRPFMAKNSIARIIVVLSSAG